jgi:ArsR family transcriptional regulator
LKAIEKAGCQARAEVFKALGHPTRLFIIEELARGERCVCELTEMIGDDISTVSKHLRLLKKAGLVSDTRQGKMIIYSLAMPCVAGFLSCVRSMLEDRRKRKRA